MRSAPAPAADGEIVGKIVEVDEAYSREIAIGWLVLGPLLVTASVARAVGLLLAAVLRRGATAGGGRRSVKDLKRGPSITVTPFQVRRPDGSTVDLEVHGHLVSGALVRGDQIVALVRPQRRQDLPPRAYRIENYTSGRAHAPHPPTVWSHLGPGLFIQAGTGLLLGALLVTAYLVGRS
jgi:hypothetical protein